MIQDPAFKIIGYLIIASGVFIALILPMLIKKSEKKPVSGQMPETPGEQTDDKLQMRILILRIAGIVDIFIGIAILIFLGS